MKHVQLGQAWRAWRAQVRDGKEKRCKVYRAAALMLRTRAAKAFRTWVGHVEWKREKRHIIQRCAACRRTCPQALVDYQSRLMHRRSRAALVQLAAGLPTGDGSEHREWPRLETVHGGWDVTNA